MGTDRESSGGDEDGRSHEVPNLTISDNSTFPNTLSVNPSLTIMALSQRTAGGHLARRQVP